MDRREMDEALAAVRAHADRDGGMLVERDVRDPDEVVAARTERLGHDHEHFLLADGQVGSGDRTMAAGDGEIAPIDGVHAPS